MGGEQTEGVELSSTSLVVVHSYLERLLGLLERLTIIVKGLRFVATVFIVLACLGGLLTLIGFVLAGWPWWLGFLLGLILALPAFFLWQFRKGLEQALTLPDRIRELPTSLEDVMDDLSPLSDALDGVIEKPKTPRAFIRSIKGTKAAMDVVNDSTYGQMIGGVSVLHPAALVAGGTLTLFAAGSLAVGVMFFLLGKALA